jgi:hypothetical protein
LKSLTNWDSAWSCCGWPPAPRPTNQLTTTPPFGPGWSAAIGGGVTAGGGVAVSTAAALALAAALGAVDEVVPPQAVTTMAAIAIRAIKARGPDRELFILVLSSSS